MKESQFDEAFDVLTLQNEQSEREQRRLEEILQSFGARLTALAETQKAKRKDIEARWLDDLAQYHGTVSKDEADKLKNSKRSSIVVNITRHKTNTAEARFIDLMFPADDKNWSMSATPNPVLGYMQEQQLLQLIQSGQITESDAEKLRREIADKAAAGMERTIEDQLIESDYAAKCRVMIHDACTIGTGIIKAPFADAKLRKRWDASGADVVLEVIQDITAGVEVVSPWDFFPDMEARNIDEAEFVFQRHVLTKQEVKNLLLLPNVLHEQIEKVLESDATTIINDNFADVRAIGGDGINTTRNRYEMWEYHGIITKDELESVGMDADYSDVVTGSVLILNGKVIRASINPLDTDALPYSVFCWEKDNNSIFGYSIPYMMRSPQNVVTAAMRMMMDNGGLSVGGQFVVNRKILSPADGSYEITPKKLWFVNDETIPAANAMTVFNIPSNQQELANIYQLGRSLIDEQSSLPAIATGEGDPNAAPQTATGVTIQSGAAKVVFKRAVKNFDDDVTVRVITRFYDWNMQYSQDRSIKGDFKVHAKGSSTLVVRDQEAKALTDLMSLATHPLFGLMIKPKELLREVLKAKQINSTTVLKSDDEIESLIKQQQENPQQSPEVMKLQMQMQVEQLKLQQKQAELQLEAQRLQAEAQQKEQQLMLNYEIEMSKLAVQQQTTVEKLKTQAGAVNAQAMLAQLREQNRREVEEAKIRTQRQIAAITADQNATKQAMQEANLRAGHDTF